MFIFDDLLNEVEKINEQYSFKKLGIDLSNSFLEDANQIIFNDDKAFELGASPLKGVALTLLTDKDFDDEIILLGDDLSNIDCNKNYARITIGSIDTSKIGEGNALYNNIRKFDYVKYHLSLKGVMVRESSFADKETLLFSKKALMNKCFNFSLLGSYILKKYKEMPFVKNVKVIFINLDEYPYEKIIALNKRSEDIIKALDHLMNNIKMDCHSCSLQVICNEVEKKVQEDFKKK